MAARHGSVQIHRQFGRHGDYRQGSGVKREKFAGEPEFLVADVKESIGTHCDGAQQRRCCDIDADPRHRIIELGIVDVSVSIASLPNHLLLCSLPINAC